MNTLPPPVPAPRGDEEIVARLRQTPVFREYQEAFQTATGLPLVLRTAGAFRAPLAGARHTNPFCALVAARSACCAGCLRVQAAAESGASAGPLTVQCFAGLSDSLVPVRVANRVVAYLQTGQVLLAAPRPARFRSALRQLRAWDAGVEAEALEAAYFRSRVLTPSHYAAAVRLLASFAEHLSLLSGELLLRETTAEPPAVTRARNHVSAHLVERLTLADVARAAHMSPFHFCKVFKAATGFTLTDFIARARVARVRELLLNPQVRVSEAAYAAGFQSLSQFNRVFRRIAGEAPTAYREHRHDAVRQSLAFAA
jgi:AraC-like DNA-binding protein/ligand-binding sensor protein